MRGWRGLDALGCAQTIIVGHRHDARLCLAECFHQIFRNELGELTVMNVGAEQPFAALHCHFCVGRADQKGGLRFGDDFRLREIHAG